MHLYLHIPFCRKACYYCDFHFSTHLNLKSELVHSICKEIELQRDFLKNKSLQTIYFGGGTPSLLSHKEFELIFDAINKVFDISQIQEVTIEVNPDDVTIENLNIWKSMGINRLSLGIQTFNDDILLHFNRNHSSKQAVEALDQIFKNGFENSSVDLIYAHDLLNKGLQGSIKILNDDLTVFSKFPIEHISAYNLTIEPQTVFGNWKKNGKLKEIEEDLAASHFEFLTDYLSKNGFVQYEVSNFAKNNKFAIHNTSYWKNEEYLGVGPSAHSYNLQTRQSNISNNAKYIRSINDNKIPYTVENLTLSDKVNDYLLSGLRTIWGVEINEIERISNQKISLDFIEVLEDFIKKEWVIKTDNQIVITQKGRIYSDFIASELFFD